MADDTKVQIEIVLDDGSVQKGFARIEQQAQKSADKMESSFSKSVGSTATKILGIATAVGSVVSGLILNKAVEAGLEAEKAIKSLNAALALNGNYSQSASDSFKNYADGIERTLGISKDLIIQNAAVLASVNKLDSDGLKKASNSALDLASALQIDIGTAFDLISKAAAGNVGAFSRYGIKLDETKAKTEGVAYVTAALDQRFGGLSKSLERTFSGALARVGEGFNSIFGAIGEAITNSPGVIAVINTIAKSFFQLGDSLEKALAGGFIDNLLIKILEAAKVINDYLIMPLEMAFNVIRTGVYTVLALDSAFRSVMLRIGGYIYDYWIKPLINALATMASSVVSFFDKDLASGIEQSVKNATAQFGYLIEAGKETSDDLAINFFDKLTESANQTFNTGMSDAISKYIDKLKLAATTTKAIGQEIRNGHKQAIDNVSADAAKAAEAINKAYQSGIMATISASVQRIGASLVKGGDAFADFRNTVLGIVGDMAINMGTTLVGIGIGIDSLKTALSTLTGGPAIVAGLALIAAGGLLKSLAGSALGTPAISTPSAQTGGGIGATPETAPAQEIANQELKKSGPQISLVVQGNIFDTQETGLRLTQIINDAFDQQGVVLTGNA